MKEQCRDARGTRWLEDLWQDFRYAFRTLRQKPGFAAVALLTLALGIGATTVMFTVINGVLLKPLPYPEPGRLVTLQDTDQNMEHAVLASRILAYFRFSRLPAGEPLPRSGGWRYGGGTLAGPEKPEYVDGFEVSSDLFSVLGVASCTARLPSREDRAGARAVVILSYGLWQRRFGGSPTAIGMALGSRWKALHRCRHRSRGFPAGRGEIDVFTPLGQDTAAFCRIAKRIPSRCRAPPARRDPGPGPNGASDDRAPFGRAISENQ